MGPTLFRVALITLGFGLLEQFLGPGLAQAGIGSWAGIAVGVVLLVGGTAGFMRPMFDSGRPGTGRGVSDDA